MPIEMTTDAIDLDCDNLIDWKATCLNVIAFHRQEYASKRDDLRLRGKYAASGWGTLVMACDSMTKAINEIADSPY